MEGGRVSRCMVHAEVIVNKFSKASLVKFHKEMRNCNCIIENRQDVLKNTSPKFIHVLGPCRGQTLV